MEGQLRNPRRNGTTRRAGRTGKATLITGCMFSGKTTELLGRVNSIQRQSSRTSIRAFKHRIDHRYNRNAIVTHDGLALAATAVNNAKEIPVPFNGKNEMIILDEAHFFDESLVDVVASLKHRGCDIIMTSLDQSSWGRPFPVVEQLVAIVDEVVTKHAECKGCGAVATHTQRIVPIEGSDLVGGAERYEPRCLACWTAPPTPYAALTA